MLNVFKTTHVPLSPDPALPAAFPTPSPPPPPLYSHSHWELLSRPLFLGLPGYKNYLKEKVELRDLGICRRRGEGRLGKHILRNVLGDVGEAE